MGISILMGYIWLEIHLWTFYVEHAINLWTYILHELYMSSSSQAKPLIRNLTEVRPLFSLSHKGSDSSPLLIVFSANNIDQFNCDLYSDSWYFGSFDLLILVYYMPEMTPKHIELCMKYAFWFVEYGNENSLEHEQ